jgi:Fic family protein
MAPTWIWQQADWPRFRWDGQRLQPLLEQAHQARGQLLLQLQALDTPLAQEAVSALLGRESLGTAAIEGEQQQQAAGDAHEPEHRGHHGLPVRT